jgi:hypothetical protein
VTPCKTPGCPNPKLAGRRLCADCRRIQSAEWQRERYTPKAHSTRPWPPCEKCAEYRRCKDERLWMSQLPCEVLLDDEVGVMYDEGAERSYYVIPLPVRERVEA